METRWPEAFFVLDQLEKQGYEAVVVGGAVRDYFLGRPVKDYDVATNATPEEVKRVFPRTIDTGILHGTVTVLVGKPIEVTTFRVEKTYSDFRRPDAVVFVRELADDLARRDFTINAMALTKEDRLIDIFSGKRDLEQKWIRAVGEPDSRFTEDALRILRGIRFSSQLGFRIEPMTEAAMKRCAHLLKHIAKERIKQEIDRIWTHAIPEMAFRYLKHAEFVDALPGSFQTLPTVDTSFSIPAEGWAWFHLFQAQVIDLPFTNKEKNLIHETKQLVHQVTIQGWTYQAVFNFSDDAVRIGYLFCQSSSPFTSEKELIEWLRKAPLRTVSEIRATGKQLMEWTGKRPGPWIRTIQQRISLHILQGDLENSQAAIKEWVNKNDTETTDFRDTSTGH